LAAISRASSPALPPEVMGINVNFCKNPACRNFGVPADVVKWRRTGKSGLAAIPGTAYKLTAVGDSRPALKCLLCGEHFSLKSNQAVAEELTRFAKYLLPSDPVCCSTPNCVNQTVPVGTAKAYKRFGKTAAGTPRWRCQACGKTLSTGGKALKRQRITHLNKTILLALTNKMPIRRILKVTGITASTLYGKIDFLYRQCLAFAGERERALMKLAVPRLYISVDRQEYMVNWSRYTDRRNIVLRAVGSADNASGYVFGMNLNFDPEVDPETVEADARDIGDAEVSYPHRTYARLWLQADYAEAVLDAHKVRARRAAKGKVPVTLGDEIQESYEDAAEREDSEASEAKDAEQRLPESRGMQVHEEYSLYGHFMMLKNVLRWVGKIRFFLDQDSGMRAACLAAFAQDIKIRRVDAFFVRTAKDLTVHAKRAELSKAKAAFSRMHEANPELTGDQVKLEMMKQEIARAAPFGKWSDRWCLHPVPNMSEPRKAICWLTEIPDPLEPVRPPVVVGDQATALVPADEPAVEEISVEDHRARLFLKASVAGIDNFFQRVRRSLNPLERPYRTSSKSGRTWYGYSPYNPVMVEKLLTIYRVMHNYVETGKDGKTPAMRLGLAKAPVDTDAILYFTP
jgi:transposase-like protein